MSGDSRCEHCGGDGFVEVDTNGTARMRRCQCAERQIRRSRIRRVNAVVPGIFRHVSLDSNPIALLPQSQRRKIRAYHKRLPENLEEGKGLWLTGASGTGKTATAALLAKRAIALGHSAFFCEVPELLNRLRWTYRDDTLISDQDLYHDLAEVELLILDDLGAPRVNDWVLEQLFIFINARYKTRRAIVVTSDVSPDALAAQINPRTIRRLHEICGAPLELTLREPDPTSELAPSARPELLGVAG